MLSTREVTYVRVPNKYANSKLSSSIRDSSASRYTCVHRTVGLIPGKRNYISTNQFRLQVPKHRRRHPPLPRHVDIARRLQLPAPRERVRVA